MHDNDKIIFKPLKTKKSIIKGRFNENISSHPIIIFCDNDGYYYYIKSRSLYDETKQMIRELKPGEIILKKSQSGLLNKDSLVDLFKIYKIKKESFQKVFDNTNPIYLSTLQLKKEDIIKILSLLNTYLNLNPPMISYYDIDYEYQKGVKSIIKYAHEDLLDYDFSLLNPNKQQEYLGLVKEIKEVNNHNPNTLNEIKELGLVINEMLNEYLKRPTIKNHKDDLEEY